MAESAFDVVLSDDFSGGYKRENWGDPFDGGVYWNGAFEWSRDDVAVRDGVMEVTMTDDGDGVWKVGGFNSFKAGNTITYGKIEFDGRVDEAQGTAGVFLTWPASDVWPRDGEIDILESPANDVMHTVHFAGPDGSHQYDSVRNQSYDPSQWNRYEMTWLPDLIRIEVNDRVVAEWTDPAVIPDVAHGFGAMGMVAAEGEAWLGGAPDGSTPDVVRVQLDNVVMSQWNGGDLGSSPDPAPTPAPEMPPVVAPAPAPPPEPEPAPAPGPVTGEVDWGATSAAVLAHYEATGAWGSLDDFLVYTGGGSAPPVVVVPEPEEPPVIVQPEPDPGTGGGEIDWNATADAVNAHFAATGSWGNLADFYVFG